MKKNSLTILGSGTCQLETTRMASSVLIEVDGNKIVFDFGRGVCQRLTERAIRQDDVNHIILSHFHPDHVSDLIPWLHAACWSRIDPRTNPLTIHGPKGLQAQLMRLMGLFGADDLIGSNFEIKLNELSGKGYRIEGLLFEAHNLPPAGNHGVKFMLNSKKIGLAGDSFVHEELISFMQGQDIIILDAGHSSEASIIQALVVAQPKQVIFTHLYSDLTEKSIAKKALAAGFNGTLLVAYDGKEIDLS